MTREQPSLLRIVAKRILLFSLLAMAMQFCIVMLDYWFNNDRLGQVIVQTQITKLSVGLKEKNGKLSFDLPEDLAQRYLSPSTVSKSGSTTGLPPGYYALVRGESGQVLFSNCDKYCEDHFLTGVGNFPTQWQKTIRPGKPISVAGGQTMQIGKLRAIVEVACIADTEGLIWGVMAHEMLDHLLIPMSLILVVVFGATTFSISSALKPVGRIAQAAMRLDPRKELTDLTATGVPREIKSLIEATNRVLRRSRDLVQSQRVFASAISHEIRTPVSIIQLELEHIDHDRARKALHDLKSLTGTLDILTLLARLDALDSKSFSRFDLTEIGGNTVIDMAPLVYADGKSIAFEHNGPVKVSSVPSLLEIMLRNIVENAVKHTPVGTAIELTVGPGAQVSIVDNPPSTPTTIRPRNIHNPVSHGIGHKIVERIADLLDITVTQSATGTGGTSTVLTLKS